MAAGRLLKDPRNSIRTSWTSRLGAIKWRRAAEYRFEDVDSEHSGHVVERRNGGGRLINIF
jgi:hypothetical protein